MRPSKLRPSPTSWWTPLTRRRPNQLIDLLLGVLLLASVAAWVGSLSPVLAIGIVVAVAGTYLAGHARREGDEAKQVTVSASSVGQGTDALDALDKRLAEAPPIPLTDWVRVDAAEVLPLVEAAVMEVTALGLPDQAHDLTRTILGGRQVPLTGQLRVDRRRARRLLDALRSDGALRLATDDEG
jgi:hypothetical protein